MQWIAISRIVDLETGELIPPEREKEYGKPFKTIKHTKVYGPGKPGYIIYDKLCRRINEQGKLFDEGSDERSVHNRRKKRKGN